MKRILIVDDEPKIIQAFLDAFIFEKDYEVASAHEGEEAIKIIQNQPLSLIVLDWRLKGKWEGKDVLLYIKDSLPRVPVIVLTASFHSEKEIQSLGADGCFLKPCPEIKDKIISFLRPHPSLR